MNALFEILRACIYMLGLGLSILLFAYITAKYKDKNKLKFNKKYDKLIKGGTKFNSY